MEAATQLVSIVGQFVGEEYQQLRGVGGQVAELSDELDTMNAILRMLSDAEEGAVDHFIRVWMKQVRELAYDAEDCVHLYILRIRCRPRDRFLVWSKRVLATLFPRRRLAREIQELRARAVVISERHARYGVSREALLRCTSSSSLAAPTPVLRHALGRPAANEPDHLVGITEQADKLSNMVEAMGGNEHDNKKLKVFSVVGFGGLGKTTLAIEVCRKLEVEFPYQAQVSVSQAFGGTKDLEGLLRRILGQIVQAKADNAEGVKEENPLDGIDNKGEADLTMMLKELLKDKRARKMRFGGKLINLEVRVGGEFGDAEEPLPSISCMGELEESLAANRNSVSAASLCGERRGDGCGRWAMEFWPAPARREQTLALALAT